MSEQPLQAASIRATAKAFSLSARVLYDAVKANELSLFRTSGRRGVLIFDDVKLWLRSRVAPTRTRTPKQKAGGDHAVA
jgi:hypothetical protein